VGVFLLSKRGGSDCVEARSFKVWKCSHVGMLTVDQLAHVEIIGQCGVSVSWSAMCDPPC
jgi:hypothetical protein